MDPSGGFRTLDLRRFFCVIGAGAGFLGFPILAERIGIVNWSEDISPNYDKGVLFAGLGGVVGYYAGALVLSLVLSFCAKALFWGKNALLWGKRQTNRVIVVWVGIGLIVFRCLFPPWTEHSRIDLPRLAIQCSIVALIVGALLYTFTAKPNHKDNGQKNGD